LDYIDKWYNEFYAVGFIEAYTGFGKTRGLGVYAIELAKPKSLIVAVPTLKLQKDWLDVLKEMNTREIDYKVIVVNTLIKNKYECDLLIIDEVHRFAADTFRETFEVVKYKQLLCFTATLERNDGKHTIILEKAPKVDTVPIEEGLKNGWVDPFEIKKIPIELTIDESNKLKRINNEYDEVVSMLGQKNPMKAAAFYICYLDLKKWVVGKKSNKVFFIRTLRINIEESLGRELKDENFDILLDKYFTVPNKHHPQFKKALAAKKFYNLIHKRKDLLYNARNKVDITLDLIEQYKNEYKFVFAQRINFIEEIADNLPEDQVRIYHSKMKNKERDASFDWFNDGRTKVKTLLSVESLNEGVDVPKLSIVIVTSYTSSPVKSVQRIGRAIRKYKDKRAIIIYLYVPDTQEEVF
jgi:superfamily II DNA or RNA helicase